MIRSALLIAWAVVAVGCASVQPVAQAPIESAQTHVVDRNYVLHQPATAYVGQPLVKVKDYWVTRQAQAALKPSEPFTIRHPLFGQMVAADPSVGIPVVGTVERGGKNYRLVSFPGAFAPLRYMLNDDGSFDGRALDQFGAFMGVSYRIEPATVRLKAGTAEAVSTGRGYINFEIVYSGTSKGEISLLYREYTPDDMARPAFTQNLTYSRDTPTVRFRDVRIRVVEANNEHIRYVVEQDGLDS